MTTRARQSIADPAGSEIALEIRHLHKSFGGVRAVAGVGFTVGRGEIVGLIGPNGSGKTTLLNVLAGYYQADAGVAALFGTNIIGLAANQVAHRGLFRTWQDPRIVHGLSVRENVALGQLARHGARHLNPVTIGTLLRKFHLEAEADRPASSLPYGQQKIVSIARTFAADPAVLLLDEPLAGLSKIEVDFVFDIIKEFSSTGSVLVVDHAFGTISRLCNRIVVLDSGRKIFEGVPAEVASSEAVREVYFG